MFVGSVNFRLFHVHLGDSVDKNGARTNDCWFLDAALTKQALIAGRFELRFLSFEIFQVLINNRSSCVLIRDRKA